MSYIFFIAFLYIFLIIPAKATLKIFNLKKDDDMLVNFGLLLVLGIVLLTLVAFLVRFLGIDFWIIWLLPVVSIIILAMRNDFNMNIIHVKRYVLIVTIIAIGVLTQDLALFRSGMPTSGGYLFTALQDNMWNISIINELFYRFPPQNPAMLGETLKNHHYFYHLFLATTRYLTKIHVFDLYYRCGPALISLMYGLSLYAISRIFTKSLLIQGLTVFLGFFSGNIAYLVPIFLGTNFDWRGNTFFADQPFDQIFNPYTVLGFAIFLYAIYSLKQAVNEDNKLHFGWSVIAGLLAGALYGFKSFGGIIAILALSLTTLLTLIKYKKFHLFKILLFSLLIFIPIFVYMTALNTVTLRWFPGWILTEMMIGQDKLNLPHYAEVENYYRSIHNLLGLGKIKFIEFLIYTIGNLGIRLLGLYYLLKVNLITPEKSRKLQIIHLFAFFSFLVAFSIPLFFNLGSSPFNIIQFTPYALILLSLYTALSLGEIFNYFQKKKLTVVGLVILIAIVALSVPVNIKNLLSKIPLSGQVVPYNEIAAVNYLKDNSRKKEIVLLYPKQFGLRDPIYIPALTERQVYLASIGFARQTGENPDTKIKEIENFFTRGFDKEFITQNGISYIYLLKEPLYREKYQHIIVEMSIFYENSDILILKI